MSELPTPCEGLAEAAVGLDEAAVARLWRSDELSLTERQTSLLPELKRWLDRRRDDPLAEYLTGKPVVADVPLASDAIAGDLFARFRPPSAGVDALTLLAKVIDRNNVEGTVRICPPPIPHLIRRQPSPFNAGRWPMLGIAADLRAALSRSIRDPAASGSGRTGKPLPEARARVGRLILSAVLHGGLVSRPALESLLRRIAESPRAIEVARGMAFVELSLDYQKQHDAEFRRWFPDPLSAVLILRLPADAVLLANRGNPPTRKGLGRLIWQCVCAVLPSTIRKRHSLRTLTNLLDATTLDLESRIPVYLANYAARKFISHSLRPDAFRRLTGLPPLPPEEGAAKASAATGSIAIRSDDAPSSDPEPRWLAPLRSAMRPKTRQEILERIESLLTAVPDDKPPDEAGRIFAGFARYLFRKPLENRSKLAVSTARTMVISVSIRIGGLTGTDPGCYDGGHWAALYEDAMEDADSPGMRRRLARALKEFQRYLKSEHGIDPIDDSDTLSAANGLVPVDANIVSHREFLAIREHFRSGASDMLPGLSSEPDPDRLAEIAWMLLTLGYRCGLRRSEALKIKTDDVCLGHESTLLVRPSELRDLKTKTSTRRMPLDILLDEKELGRLREFLAVRSGEKFLSDFLFSVPAKQELFAAPELMFGLLLAIMRDVTGDPGLRFHHLRHSFASKTFLSLAASQGQSMGALSQLYPDEGAKAADAQPLRQKFFGKTGTTRRDIWAVASLLGHSAPDISVEHYIHHLDAALAEALKDPAIAPGRPTVIAAAGVFPSQASREIGPGGLPAWIALLHKRRFGETVLPLVEAPPAQARPAPITAAPAGESLTRIWRLLFVAATMRRDIPQLSERSGVPRKKIIAYAAHAQWLSQMTLSPHGRKFRHRFMKWPPDRGDPHAAQRIYCPIKPREERDTAVVRRLGEAFRAAFVRDPRTVADAVGLFAREAHPEYGGLIFRNPDQPQAARNFLDFLTLLGCAPDEIEFTGHDKTGSRELTFGKWRTALGLEESVPFKVKSPPNGRSDWPCQWLGIQPVFDEKNGRREGSAGFRFLMIMAAIAMRAGKQGRS